MGKVEIVFQPFVQQTLAQYKNRTFSEIQQMNNNWDNEEIIDYFKKIPTDEPTKYLAKTIKDTQKNFNVLCVGGGIGRLGRHILEIHPQANVVEIDSSKEMVNEANYLADKLNLHKQYLAIHADANQLPFSKNEFDHTIAYGVFRYINESQRATITSNLVNISKQTTTIAEGKAKDIIYDLKKQSPIDFNLNEIEMPMFRMTLFYLLLQEYKKNPELKKLVNNNIDEKQNYIDILSKVAGSSQSTLYELKFNKSFKIKEASTEDVSQIEAILLQHIYSRNTGQIEKEEIENIKKQIIGEKDIYNRLRKYFIVKNINDQIVGCMAYTTMDPDMEKHFNYLNHNETKELVNVFVDSNYQKQGIAKKLFKHICQFLKKEGVKQVVFNSGNRYKENWEYHNKISDKNCGFIKNKYGQNNDANTWIKYL
jgi:ubiquinone/menaquinone biosynthesis C-methylase UbiE/N-acetylglutamate synthase-like GNAT family acetyltransferase